MYAIRSYYASPSSISRLCATSSASSSANAWPSMSSDNRSATTRTSTAAWLSTGLAGLRRMLAAGRSYRLTAVLLLGFASGLPLALTGQALQAWLAVDGVNIATRITSYNVCYTKLLRAVPVPRDNPWPVRREEPASLPEARGCRTSPVRPSYTSIDKNTPERANESSPVDQA